jgi:hypothetical protein
MTRTEGTLHEYQHIFTIIYRSFLFRIRNISDKSCRENQNTDFVFENHAVCEIMWKNIL